MNRRKLIEKAETFHNNNREEREAAWRLVNNYHLHSKETGFLEWSANTPIYIKQLYLKLIASIA